MNIDALQAGPELDALVAEKVMGFTVIYGFMQVFEDATPIDIPKYSTDIAAAWQIVEKMRGCASSVWDRWEKELFDGHVLLRACALGDAPFLISRAALKAVGA